MSYDPNDPERPFVEADNAQDGPGSAEVGPERENDTDVIPGADTSHDEGYTQESGPRADGETGEVVEDADSSSIDAALLPLADAPVTYSTLQFIANTEFVPKALRGRPEAVLAAVLFGRELGLEPMQSLTHIHMVDGRPSPSAELLARLIRDAGHQVEVLEASDEVCHLRGTRADTGEALEVSFSVADARRVTTKEHGQRIRLADTKRWTEYPADLCWARAITRLHRRLFPDVATLGSFGPKDRHGQ